MITHGIFEGISHLETTVWQEVNLNLLAKSLAELMHEQVLAPLETERGENGLTQFRINTDRENVWYTFSASPRMLDYWHVYSHSIRRCQDNRCLPAADVPLFFTDMQQTLGIKPATLARYIEELNNTLFADATMRFRGRPSAAALAAADYQEVEHQMDGHPWVIVNKGRIGFDAHDYRRYAPEHNREVLLSWIAVHRSRATFRSLEEISETAFLEQELGKEKLDAFKSILTGKGLNAGDYTFIPVHEWQWNNKVLLQFSGEIANNFLVPLGTGNDVYTPQQSIRTFYNVTHPHKHYVKMAISILSTGNIRGLSPRQMAIAPRITAWVKGMLEKDTVLHNMGLILLGEVATVTYLHPHYTAIANAPYQFNEMLGVLWRESAEQFVRPGETIVTMASLLYVDDEGKSLAGALIARSGLTTAAWLKAYLTAYLKPLLHIYYAHSLCVTPHGENIILVMKDNIPARIIIKDFVDDIVLTAEAREKLPADLADGLIQSSNKENVPLFILLGVFDAFFRYLSDVLHTCDDFNERLFWKEVADTIAAYQQEHPELQERFVKYDLYVETFKRFYINSLRLLYHGYEDRTDFAIPPKGGVLVNPLVEVAVEALKTA
ncbi:IucA/IucC family protein [Chitinophaga polysaccharea]|uniref:IucA/IucC family protein n=1 Tax=Chitinophaga polysaccharea TaxID=1293035 RepID=UPI00115B10D9|nr:IucA/IucC family protein [Chitinophaga polysaccharea]